MQVNLLRALVEKLGEAIRSISIYPMAAYPKGENLIIRERKERVFNDIPFDTHIPYILNLPFIKNIYEMVSTYRMALKLYKEKPFDKILIFNAFPATAWAALKLKKKYGCELICLLADLPIDDSVHTKGLKKILRRRMDIYTKNAIKKMDKLIVLNEEAAKIYAPNVPYIVVEGAVDKNDVHPYESIIPARKNIVFAGSLQKYNGIVELIEAVRFSPRSIDEAIRLRIGPSAAYEAYGSQGCQHYGNGLFDGTCLHSMPPFLLQARHSDLELHSRIHQTKIVFQALHGFQPVFN